MEEKSGNSSGNYKDMEANASFNGEGKDLDNQEFDRLMQFVENHGMQEHMHLTVS